MSKLPLAAVLLAATPLFAQQTGVSHPPDVEIEAAVPDQAPARPANVPVVSAPVLVVPQTAAVTTPNTSYAAADESPAATLKHRDLAKFDPDGEIVTSVPVNPHEIAAGTMVHARLKTTIETATTQPGTPFRAEITEPLVKDGRVIVPAGSAVEGHITDVRGGRRFRGPALIHLQAQTIILPDGSRMPIHASVVDTDQFNSTRIDDEGNIIRKDHAKQTLAAMSLTTGGAAAAGGVIAGPAGALVGAGIGAGVSTIWWLKQDRQTEMPADSMVVLALTEPLPIQPLVQEPNFSTQPAPSAPAMPMAETPAYKEPQSFVPMN